MPLIDRLLGTLWRHRVRGATRLHLAVRGRGPLSLRTAHGLRLGLSPFDYIDRIVIAEGYYESEVLAALLDALGSGETLWDVGANLGLHALTAKLLRPDATVVAFEPNPPLADRLAAAARGNRLDVRLERYALGRESGAATLYLHDGNSGMGSLTDWRGTGRPVPVAVRTGAAAVAAGVARPDVVKIDVEGNEAAVLAGLGDLLDSAHTVVFEDGPGGDTAAKAVLAGRGFVVRRLGRREQSGHALENFVASRRT